jgi:hypothetical protein
LFTGDPFHSCLTFLMAECFVPAPLGPNIRSQGGAGALRTLKNARRSARSTIDPEFRSHGGQFMRAVGFFDSPRLASLRVATHAIFEMRTKLSFGRAIG